MSAAKVPYGKPVKLLVDYEGYPDGRLVLFEIWRKKGGSEEKVTKVYGVTKGGEGIGYWTPQLERKKILPLQKKVSEQVAEEKYYFIAKIDDQEAKSEEMMFTFPLDIYLKDTDRKPLDGAKFTITFKDGSKKEGVFKDGHARLEEAPPGKFKLELKDYEFVLEE